MTMSDEAKRLKNEYQRDWKNKNKTKLNEYQRAWRSKNKDKVNEYNAKYWERKAAGLV